MLIKTNIRQNKGYGWYKLSDGAEKLGVEIPVTRLPLEEEPYVVIEKTAEAGGLWDVIRHHWTNKGRKDVYLDFRLPKKEAKEYAEFCLGENIHKEKLVKPYIPLVDKRKTKDCLMVRKGVDKDNELLWYTKIQENTCFFDGSSFFFCEDEEMKGLDVFFKKAEKKDDMAPKIQGLIEKKFTEKDPFWREMYVDKIFRIPQNIFKGTNTFIALQTVGGLPKGFEREPFINVKYFEALLKLNRNRDFKIYAAPLVQKDIQNINDNSLYHIVFWGDEGVLGAVAEIQFLNGALSIKERLRSKKLAKYLHDANIIGGMSYKKPDIIEVL